MISCSCLDPARGVPAAGEVEVDPACRDRARLVGSIGSILVEDAVAAHQRQMALDVFEKTGGEPVGGSMAMAALEAASCGIRAVLLRGVGQLPSPGWNWLLSDGACPSAANSRAAWRASRRTSAITASGPADGLLLADVDSRRRIPTQVGRVGTTLTWPNRSELLPWSGPQDGAHPAAPGVFGKFHF